MNPSPFDPAIDAFVDAHAAGIVHMAQGLLRIPSTKGEPSDGAPFGKECLHALQFALDGAAAQGLTVKNVDGYAGHAEWRGENVDAAAPIVGVLAHVDVVPAGDGWSSPPFAAEIVDGAIVGRGAIDDKGPAIAGLWAILALKACGVPLTKRIRLILGADEESGFGCVHHYFQHEEMPETGFTPDAMFPLVYAEKGIANAVLTRPAPPEGERIHVVSFAGGLRPNMVPDRAEVVLRNLSPFEAMRARVSAVVGISTEALDSGGLLVTARGVSAHGSTPHQGVNAIAVLCDALLLLDHREDQVEVIQRVCAWAEDTTGGKLGIAGADNVAGPLTCNLGIASYAGDLVTLTFNIRYPVTWDGEKLRSLLLAHLSGTAWTLAEFTDQPPLYVPQDDPLTQTLLDVYRAETGDARPPETMGGGTYARAMHKGVAFGAMFPDTKAPGPHEKDEAWPVADLLRATKIYAKALARLAQ